MMKKTKTLQKGNLHTIILLISLIACVSCDSRGQKGSSESIDSKLKTSIHKAALMGDLSVLKAHVAAKTDLNQKDAYGSAPLNIAAVFGKPEVAKLLIEAGADVNVKNGDGSTPLHSAAFFCRTEIARMLINAGADATIRNNYGSTALESISVPFEEVKGIYDQLGKDLGPLGLKLDYEHIKATRPIIAEMIRSGDN